MELLSLVLFLFTYPAVDSQEFCDAYEDYTGKQLDEIVEKELQKNQMLLYFLSKFPDATTTTIIGESLPPRFTIFHEYDSNGIRTQLVSFFIPCFYHYPFPNGFDIYDKKNDIEISINNGYDRETHQTLNDDKMFKAIYESSIYQTHQKWLNHKNQTVYVFPESVDTLTERGYLTKQIDFFDFEKVRP